MKNLSLADSSLDLIPLLINPGYGLYPARLPDLSIQSLQPLIDTFIELTNLPLHERQVWAIDADNDGDHDDGLIERNGGPYDHKFFFHYKNINRILPALAGKEMYERDKDKWNGFLNDLNNIHANLSQDMHDIVKAIDELLPWYDLLKKVKAQPISSRAVLRLLYYKPGHTVVAKPHYDQSLLTFHVADSRPGLIVGKENEVSKNIYFPDGASVLVFPGIKAEIATEGSISAGYHSAIADDVSMQEGRWSIVFFYHCNIGISASELTAIIKQKINLAS